MQRNDPERAVALSWDCHATPWPFVYPFMVKSWPLMNELPTAVPWYSDMEVTGEAVGMQWDENAHATKLSWSLIVLDL